MTDKDWERQALAAMEDFKENDPEGYQDYLREQARIAGETDDFVYTVVASPQANEKIVRVAEHFRVPRDMVASIAAGVGLGTRIEVELEDSSWDFLRRRAEELDVLPDIIVAFALRTYANAHPLEEKP